MSITDNILFRLGRENATYLEEVVSIYYKDKSYRLAYFFQTAQCLRCGICGSCPITEIFVIKSENGEIKKIGKNCVNRLTNMEVSKWFRNYKKRRKNIINNSKKIECLSGLLKTCKNCGLSGNIPFEEVEKIRVMLERMVKGLELDWQQEALAESYLDKKKKLCD